MSLFIAVEGADGAGKSVQVKMLGEWLTSLDVPNIVTKQPGANESQVCKDIRKILLHSEYVDPKAETFLFLADRAHHVGTVIKPALSEDIVVVTDRYQASTMVYQWDAREPYHRDFHCFVDALEEASYGVNPDLTIILDVPVSIGMERIGARGELDRMEKMGEDFHGRVRDSFLKLSAAYPDLFIKDKTIILDGTKSVEDIHEDIKQLVQKRL